MRIALLNQLIDKLDYDMIEIYQYNQEPELTNYLQSLSAERNELIKRMDRANDFHEELEINKRIKQIERFNPFEEKVLGKDGTLNKSARLVKRIRKDDSSYQTINALLERKVEHPVSRRGICKYRNGLIFSKSGFLIEALSICFTNWFIYSKNEGPIYADMNFFGDFEDLIQEWS